MNTARARGALATAQHACARATARLETSSYVSDVQDALRDLVLVRDALFEALGALEPVKRTKEGAK